MQLKVAGIDPSMSNFGLVRGVLDLKEGSFSIDRLLLAETKAADKATRKVVRKNSDDLNRAVMAHRAMMDFIQDTSLIFVEIPVGSQSARAMASYGMCIGILAAIQKPLIQVTPTEVKLAATGKKTATKAEMIDWATTRYPDAEWLRHKSRGEMVLGNKNEHLADAVAAIHAGCRTEEFNRTREFFLASM